MAVCPLLSSSFQPLSLSLVAPPSSSTALSWFKQFNFPNPKPNPMFVLSCIHVPVNGAAVEDSDSAHRGQLELEAKGVPANDEVVMQGRATQERHC